VTGQGAMYLNEYALHKIVESRLAELREDAERRHALTPREELAPRAGERTGAPSRWTLAYILGR
jgi:hypothetical protein